jgi:hypothetical protein
MRTILFSFFNLVAFSIYCQNVSMFLETNSNDALSGMDISDNYLYVISWSGKVHRKNLNSTGNIYETFNLVNLNAQGLNSIKKVGDFVYISKSTNGLPSNSGIYRFNPNIGESSLELFINMMNVSGLAHRNSELFFSASDKIFKVNVDSLNPTPIQIVDNISGTAPFGTSGSTEGLKVYGDYLYVTDVNGISKINLVSGNYEKETISTYTGNSLAMGNNNKIYLTTATTTTSNPNGVFELDIQTQSFSLLTEITDFIGTRDIISYGNTLYVTTLEGNGWDKVAKIDSISSLNCSNNTTISPQISSLTLGSTAIFSAFSSFPNPSFVWQSDFGQGYVSLNDYGNYSGTSTNTISISNIQLSEHNQPIRVISTSVNCIDTSNVATLNILDTCISNTTIYDTLTTQVFDTTFITQTVYDTVTIFDTLFTTVIDTLIINTTLNLPSPNNENTILIYPNPANDHITIDNGNYLAMAGYSIKITNNTGQQVFTSVINQPQFYIDLSTWSGNGLYYLNLIDPQNNTVTSRKIVIQ